MFELRVKSLLVVVVVGNTVTNRCAVNRPRTDVVKEVLGANRRHYLETITKINGIYKSISILN